MDLTLEIDAKAILGEGPYWDIDDKLLYWVDIMGKNLHIYNPTTKINRTIEVEEYVSCVVVSESRGLILTTQNGIFSFSESEGVLIPIANPESHLPKNRFNDGKCDFLGRFWVGTMSFDGRGNFGSLYCLNNDRKVIKMKGNISISNGLSWSPDNRTMYYVDSPTRQVVAFDFDAQTGVIKNEKIVITIPAGEGVPDGITTDKEGALWIAQWGGSKVSRWDPSNGKLLDFVTIPATQVTSCAFGGDNLNELFITTARIDLDERSLEGQPNAGGVFCLKTNVQGMPMYKFNG